MRSFTIFIIYLDHEIFVIFIRMYTYFTLVTTHTTCLPTYLPLNRPTKAAGAFSSPMLMYTPSPTNTKGVGLEPSTEQEPVRKVEGHHEPQDEPSRRPDDGRVVDPVQQLMNPDKHLPNPNKADVYPHPEPLLALLVQRHPAEPWIAREVGWREALQSLGQDLIVSCRRH